MRFEVDDFVVHRSNTLRGFFTVYFIEGGFAMSGFSLHENESTGARWIELPAKQNKSGEYEKILNPYDTRLIKKFKEQVLKTLDEHRRGENAKAEKNTNPDPRDQ